MPPHWEINPLGKAALKVPIETLEVWLWLHLVATACYQDPFLGERRYSPSLGRHSSTLKHISNQEHDLMEEYRSDSERHIALSPLTQLLEK
ncbi:hypothetical protein TNCV_4308101 [Trichonephila clavipes]|nr:hypothetical protein TNCV_4308101 [Trichonephila clavipes]